MQKRHPDDKDNPVTAVRIAESRAKIRLYKFMYDLTGKLYFYYYDLLFGGANVTPGSRRNTNKGLWDMHDKYTILSIMESHHLGKLLEES